MKWESVRLKDCCSKIGSGSTPRGGSQVYIEEGTSLIRSQNVHNLRFEYEGLAFITNEAARTLAGVTVRPSDVLLNITGDSVARTCLVPDSTLPARVNQHVAIIRPLSNVLNAKFLSYYLASPHMQQVMLGLAVGKGASRNAITKEMIEQFEIPCPPIHNQEQVVSILSTYDGLIENNRRQIKLLEEAAQRLYKEWFVDLRFPGWEKTPIVDGLPKYWHRVRLGDTANIVMGQSPKSEFFNARKEGLPFHQGVGSFGNRFVIDDTYSLALTRIGEAGSILFSVRAPVGRLNLTRNRVVIGRGIAAVNSKYGHQSLLFYMLKDRFFEDDLIGNGSIFGSINKDELHDLTFIYPSAEIADAFNFQAKAYDEMISVLHHKIQDCQLARDALLPILINGELEV